MLEHFVSRDTTELTYVRRSSHTKDVTTENIWTFELGVESSTDVPIYVIVRFMQRDQFDQEHQNNETFYTPTVAL